MENQGAASNCSTERAGELWHPKIGKLIRRPSKKHINLARNRPKRAADREIEFSAPTCAWDRPSAAVQSTRGFSVRSLMQIFWALFTKVHTSRSLLESIAIGS